MLGFYFVLSISVCFVDCVLHVFFASCAFTDSVSGLWSFDEGFGQNVPFPLHDVDDKCTKSPNSPNLQGFNILHVSRLQAYSRYAIYYTIMQELIRG